MANKDIVPTVLDARKIRTTRNEKGETVYCLSDVFGVSVGTERTRRYIYDVRKSLEKQGIQLSDLIGHFKFRASNGKTYKMWGGTREQIFRVLEESHSPKLASVKTAVAHLANERVEEIENPAKGIENSLRRWKEMEKSDPWIDARVKGIGIRKEETAVLQSHGISQPKDFAHFTDRTNVAVYGHTAKVEKSIRKVGKSQSLRDSSTQTELVLLSLHETACATGIEKTDAYGRLQIDGVYDVVGGIISNTKQALENAFKEVCA